MSCQDTRNGVTLVLQRRNVPDRTVVVLCFIFNSPHRKHPKNSYQVWLYCIRVSYMYLMTAEYVMFFHSLLAIPHALVSSTTLCGSHHENNNCHALRPRNYCAECCRTVVYVFITLFICFLSSWALDFTTTVGRELLEWVAYLEKASAAASWVANWWCWCNYTMTMKKTLFFFEVV